MAGGYFLMAGAHDLYDSSTAQADSAKVWDSGPPVITPADLKPGDAFAKLSIPRLNATRFVVEGTGEAELRLGPGHMEGTAIPGEADNCIIAGHRDTHFRVLKDIKRGDDIVLETERGKFLYRVTMLSVVTPEETSVLAPSTQPILNLITCYPFYYIGSAPKRFIVRAELADPPEVWPSAVSTETETVATKKKSSTSKRVRTGKFRKIDHARSNRRVLPNRKAASIRF